jgi:methylmalonyl-CoA/ethylmalonyl-CoA epimerase
MSEALVPKEFVPHGAGRGHGDLSEEGTGVFRKTKRRTMLEKIDHIGIAVKDLEQAIRLYKEAFGIEPSLVYESEYTKAKIAFFPIGQTRIELIQPINPESVMGKFLEKKGEGIHHVSFKVKDVEQSLREIEAKGVQLIDKQSRKVRENERVAFLHPKSTNGVLFELIQED